MRKYFLLKLSFFLLVFLIFIFNSVMANDGNDVLRETILEYYKLEQKESWNKTYEFRPPEFKKSVPKDTYIKMMQDDNNGWHLINFEILSIKQVGDKAIAKIKFKEECPQGYYSGVFKAKYMNIEEKTEWESINDKWFCVDCGTRTHLSLNADMVAEY